jgi:methylamine--corrinoid protein Co-methyltransferase
MNRESGLRHSDIHECSQLNELKVNMDLMSMISAWHLCGDNILVEQMPIFGGYQGGLEETAICDVAATLASFAVMGADIHLGGPIHVRWGTTTNRQSMQISAHTAMAIDSNTDVLLANQYYTMAGPCTDMNLLEIIAQSMCDTVCGRELLSGVASAKGVKLNMTTGMEARMLGESSMATCGMSLPEVNDILNKILEKYEGRYRDAPVGLPFERCYHVDTVEPVQEYLDVYDRVLDTVADCGIMF